MPRERGHPLRVEWLEDAAEERRSQLRYIAGENPSAALRIDDQIVRQTRLLADSPRMGRIGREPDTREMVISRSPFILVYRISRTKIEILRFLHGRQQWPVKRGSPKQYASLEDDDE